MAESGRVMRAGYAIAWRLGGDPSGEPLVLLHSLGTHSAMWRPQERSFADRRLLLLDWPGHGGSTLPPADRPITIASLCDDALAVLDAFGWKRADVLGLSLGGMIGLALAAHHPDRVRRLVASNCAARIADPTLLQQRLQRLPGTGLAAIADDVLAGWFSPACQRERPELVALARRWLLAGSAEGYSRTARAVIAADLRPVLGRIACPVTLIAGSCDRPTPPAWQHEIAEAIAGARVHEIPAAHLANLECDRDYDAIIRSAMAPG